MCLQGEQACMCVVGNRGKAEDFLFNVTAAAGCTSTVILLV